ncbi:hypothetical protein, partial [Streptomyces griseus]|uniref:hypothetical protein n=1 Tax=Streptomyces griseus TaxID=1911 RepID=UPI001C5A41B8
MNGGEGRATEVTPRDGSRSRIAVSSSAAATGALARVGRRGTETAGSEWMVHRPGSCRRARGCSAGAPST